MNQKILTWILILAACVLLTLCVVACDPAYHPENQQHSVQSKPQAREYVAPKRKLVVKAKDKSEETDYHYKFNIWRGRFYHQPNIHTVYTIIYSDGSTEEVDVSKFYMINVGDTILK